MKIKTFSGWLLDVIMQKPDGFGLAKAIRDAVTDTLAKYEPLNELEYE